MGHLLSNEDKKRYVSPPPGIDGTGDSLASVLDGLVKGGSSWTISERGGDGFVVVADR
jgi:hypothetical protein